MNDPTQSPPSSRRGWLVFAVTVIAVFLLGLLSVSIIERRVEATASSRVLQPIAEWESDSSKWSANWPREYASYKQMEQTDSRTKYGGAGKRDLLEEDPNNVILFAGYAFAKDYNQARGHTYAIRDVLDTGRDISTKPGTCWTCKSPDVPRLMAQMGPAKFYDTPAKELAAEVTHPIGCADCHDPKTMALTITRPALKEAFERQGKDISKASHQEMRSLVCAQCHVEYYFKKDEAKGQKAYLTFPWDKGTGVEQMDEYYENADFADWVHPISGARMIKMQHPDYEVYSKGVHAYRNVSCADCHMPYRTEGGQKFTDHHVQSPLLNIANSCAVCHRWGENDIRARVESIQDKINEGRLTAEIAICRAHFDIAACKQVGIGDDDLKKVRALVRKAQLRWDYVAANNGMGFHAPQECQRILAAANDLAQECRIVCARLLATKGISTPVVYPDWSSKAKAQELIKLFAKDGKPPALLTQAAASGPATPADAPIK
ncbi:MAG: ammonia-forming cytochrome c nitrite reductase subunit c552 [Planctomycetota bacterium]